MSELERIAAGISGLLPEVKWGSLRIWGDWFGRPYDGMHRLVGARADGETLVFDFAEGERLTVWSPRGVKASAELFLIEAAERARWEWHSSVPRADANRCAEEHEPRGRNEPAVELV